MLRRAGPESRQLPRRPSGTARRDDTELWQVQVQRRIAGLPDAAVGAVAQYDKYSP